MKRITNKNVLTVLSILSVLALFAGTCILALLGLYRLGALSIPLDEEEGSISKGEADTALPVHICEEETVLPSLTGVEAAELLLREMPFSDNYYLKIELVSDRERDPVLPETGTYEIWRYGERFQINQYSLDDEIVHSVTCDGSFVQIRDYRTATNEYCVLSSNCNFYTFSPVPSFEDMKNKVYRVSSFREQGDICTIIYEYDEGDMLEKIEVSKESGVIETFVRRFEGEMLMRFTVVNKDFSFLFEDYMFDFN